MEKITFCLLFILVANSCFGQLSIASQKTSISAQNKEIETILSQISQNSKINFTYNPDIFLNTKPITINKTNCSVSTILDEILDQNIGYTIVGNNIVLHEKTDSQTEKNNISITKLKGKIVDFQNKTALPYAAITLNNSTLGTISNEEGVFNFSIANANNNDTICITYLGYESIKIPVSKLKENTNNEIALKPKTFEIGTITISPTEADKILNETIQKLKWNYDRTGNTFKAFYRESYYSDSAFISRAEANINIYKPTGTDFSKNKIEISEGRRTSSKNVNDVTLKLRGGPYFYFDLDFANRVAEFLSKDRTKNYNYLYLGNCNVDGLDLMVVSFSKKENSCKTNYNGRMFIDKDSKAIAKIEFEILPDNKTRNAHNKKGNTVEIEFKKQSYRINYVPINGKWYLQSTIGQQTRQITDSTGKTSLITSVSQLVVTETTGSTKLPQGGFAINRNDIFYDCIKNWQKNKN